MTCPALLDLLLLFLRHQHVNKALGLLFSKTASVAKVFAVASFSPLEL